MIEVLIFLVGLSAGSCIAVMVLCLRTIAKQSDDHAPGQLDRMLDEPIGGRIDKRI